MPFVFNGITIGTRFCAGLAGAFAGGIRPSGFCPWALFGCHRNRHFFKSGDGAATCHPKD